MKKLLKIIMISACLLAGGSLYGQNASFDVFKPISKYLALGDVESLSAWMADNLEITIFSNTTDASKRQAKQILQSFFDSYSPRSFVINHTADKGNMKYALGTLKAGGEDFGLTLFVNYSDDRYTIQQLKISRLQ